MKADLITLVNKSNLEPEKSEAILSKFREFESVADNWAEEAYNIVVTDESQTDLMKQAREGRLLLKGKRVEIEKRRKELKEQSLREGQAIDAVAKQLKSIIEPIEDYLDKQERFIEIKRQQELAELVKKRTAIIQQITNDPNFLSGLDTLTQVQFDAVVNAAKAKVQADIKAEEERQAQLKAEAEERERFRKENEKLREEVSRKEEEVRKQQEALKKEREKLAEAKKENKTIEAELTKIKAVETASETVTLEDFIKQLQSIRFPNVEIADERVAEFIHYIKTQIPLTIKKLLEVVNE